MRIVNAGIHGAHGTHRTGSLSAGLTEEQICSALGFDALPGEGYKVTREWYFSAQLDGKWFKCGIWDYKGSRWSTYGPREIFDRLFPGLVREA